MEDGNGNLSEEEEEEEEKAAAAAAAPLPAGPRDCSRRWSPADRARFDAWTSSVLPRARGAIERAFDDGSEKGGEDSLELPLPFASKPLPLEVNGIADLPLSALRAGLLPAHLNAEAAEEGGGEGFGLDAVAARLAEWLRFPYAAEAVLDAAAASLAAASSGEEQEEEDPLSLSLLPSLFKRRRRHPKRPLPASVDWSTEGVLGPVKNQHINGTPCGCCWAFATTGVVEGIVGVVSGKRPPSLSEQQLIDCDRGGPFDDLGCEGGSVEGKEKERGFGEERGEGKREEGRRTKISKKTLSLFLTKQVASTTSSRTRAASTPRKTTPTRASTRAKPPASGKRPSNPPWRAVALESRAFTMYRRRVRLPSRQRWRGTRSRSPFAAATSSTTGMRE